MKKTLFILLMLPAMLLAAPVPKEHARAIGENFFSKSIEAHRISGKKAHFVSQQQPNMRKVRQNTGNTYDPYYIFNNEEGGFVIVAGDDCATPILGYSTEGCIDPNNLPIQLEELLNEYAEEIQLAAKNNDQATDSIKALWNAYYSAPQSRNAKAAVNALIATSWNQYPYYNIKCPSDQSLPSRLEGHTTTGCVATAMAQIMKYWEYPETGTGNKSYRSQRYGTLSANFANTTYEWDNMPNKLTSSSTSTQKNAVATLMYHCGVAVEMDYNNDGQGGSGAYTLDMGGGRPSAEKAFKTYFGYASTVSGKKSSAMSTSAWKSLLKSELDNKRPMLYRGESSQGGHAFICDGYDSNDLFHFNWGWGGQENGFYALTAGSSNCHNFTKDQQAVIGIKPADGSGPAKNYLLYMNTDLTAQNTSNTGSSTDVNPYLYGNTMKFTAKVENNGTGAFNGSFRVAAFTNDGEFVAWSKESHHFSLGAGNKTVVQTFTFDGGIPFIPGKYRAYMYYKDDDETEWKYVKTDHGVIFTEYNNVAFTVMITKGDLIPYSAFTLTRGSLTSSSFVCIKVDIKNTAWFTTFYGKIRLNLYNSDGTRAQIIDEQDFTSSGFSSSTTYTLYFLSDIIVDPGTYYMALVYQKKNETNWYFMRSIDSYPNFVKVNVVGIPLVADDYEVNNTQSTASTITWEEIDEEMTDFGTGMVSIHEEADIDYYKLEFPKSNNYKVAVSLYDKYNNQGHGYRNGDVQYSYSIDGNTYSTNYIEDIDIYLSGPTTLYLRVIPLEGSCLGFYEISGDITEFESRGDCKTVPYTETFASSQGDFTVYNSVLPSGFSSIWNWDSQYGMVAKCIKGSTKYESESYLISPCVEIPVDCNTTLSFRHAAKFFQDTSQMTLWISTDYDSSYPSAAHWTQLPIQTYPSGQNWNWFNSGLISLHEYKGQYVNLAFKYKSSTSYAPQWEIKDFKMEQDRDDIEEIQKINNSSSKILRNGQILILRGDKTYTLTGQEVQ